MGKWLERPVPLKWFSLLMVAYIATALWGYFENVNHEAKFDAFMSAGGRFTKEDGDRLEARVLKLEETCEQ